MHTRSRALAVTAISAQHHLPRWRLQNTALAESFTARAIGLRVGSSWHPPHGSVVMLVEPKEAYHWFDSSVTAAEERLDCRFGSVI